MDARDRFERLYHEHADRVHSYACRRSDRATADDIVADVFVVAWRRLDRVPDEPLPWLIAVARKVLANRRRADKRIAALQDRLRDNVRPCSDDGNLDGDVLTALATLGERDAELLLLIAWDGLSQTEVAEVLGIRRAAVATRLHRARRRLMTALSAQNVSRVEVGR